MLYKICLHCIAGKEKGKKWKFAIKDNTVVIGRLKGCHLVLSDDQASQSHCLLQVQDGELCLIDMGSSKGTYIDDCKAEGKYRLKNNETIQVGTTFLKLEVISPDSTKIFRSQINLDTPQKLEKSASTVQEENIPEEVLFQQFSHEKKPDNGLLTKSKDEDEAFVNDFIAHNNLSPNEDFDSTNVNVQICVLCEKNDENLNCIDTNSQWLYCSDCKELANFIAKDWQTHQIVGSPVWINNQGILVLSINKEKQQKEYVYIERQKSSTTSIEIFSFDENITLKVLRRERVQGFICTFYRFVHGNFWNCYEQRTPVQTLKIAIKIATKIEKCTLSKTYTEISPQNIYITACGEPILFYYPFTQQLPDTSFNKRNNYLAPEILTQKETHSTKANIFSFAAILFTSIYKQKVYESLEHKAIITEAENLNWKTIEKKINSHPIINKFFAKTICSSKTRYSSWTDVINSLHMTLLMLKE